MKKIPVLHKAFPEQKVMVFVRPFPRLELTDLCDARCSARAIVRVRLRATGGRLDFCRHHWKRHEASLRPLCDAIQDESADLLGVGEAK